VSWAADVARIGYDGWTKRKVIVIPGFPNRQGVALVRFAPRSMVRKIVKRLNS
jgi:hypothetical protein